MAISHFSADNKYKNTLLSSFHLVLNGKNSLNFEGRVTDLRSQLSMTLHLTPLEQPFKRQNVTHLEKMNIAGNLFHKNQKSSERNRTISTVRKSGKNLADVRRFFIKTWFLLHSSSLSIAQQIFSATQMSDEEASIANMSEIIDSPNWILCYFFFNVH